MPCPHFSVTIVSRGKGGCTVAGASYQSGDKLFFDQAQKNFSYQKPEGEVVHKEIMLPANAPPEYENREALWNAVEDVETQWNAQLARRIHITLPKEIPLETSIELVREYCEKQFKDEGMCVDLCVHDPHPPGHNPHAHVMLTMRSIDEEGRWMPKAQKEYILDENGEKIRLPSGGFKSRKVYPNNWNDRGNVEKWRHEWEVAQNKYLERAGVPERIDMRSYERQGVDQIPTVHMGPAVTYMEKKGIQTGIGDLNREIRKTNGMITFIKNTIANLFAWIAELHEKQKALRELWKEYKQEPKISELLGEYYGIRSEGRKEWNSADARIKWAAHDMNEVGRIMDFLEENRLYRLPDLHDHLSSLEAKKEDALGEIKPVQKRMKEIQQIRSATKTLKELQPIQEAYDKIFFKKHKEKYAAEHSEEIKQYRKATGFLKKVCGDKPINGKALTTEYKRLEKVLTASNEKLEMIKADLKQLNTVRYYVSQVLPEEPEPKEVSIHDRMNEAKARSAAEQSRQKDPKQAKKELQPQRPKQSKQLNNEL